MSVSVIYKCQKQSWLESWQDFFVNFPFRFLNILYVAYVCHATFGEVEIQLQKWNKFFLQLWLGRSVCGSFVLFIYALDARVSFQSQQK